MPSNRGELNLSAYEEIITEARKLAEEKYKGYGPDNIGAFADFGCLVRANDKIQRMKTIYLRRFNSGVSEDKALVGAVPDEKIDDDIKDAINYLVYMLMCRRGQWM
jgi:hypothetical protein